MIYLIGTTSREYSIDGVIIPKKLYNEREVELGKRSVIEIDDVVYAKLSTNKIFTALVKNGDVLVKDKPPEEAETMPELRARLSQEKDNNAALVASLREEIEQLKEGKDTVTKTEFEALKKEALEEINKKDAEIKELKEQLEEATQE